MFKKLFTFHFNFLFLGVLALSVYIVLIPGKVYASVLFLDEFNGNGELHTYNNAYIIENLNNSTSTFDLSSDHLVTSGFDPRYIYTGIPSENICASIDFNWSSGGDWTELLLHSKPNNPPDNSIQFYIERPGRIPGVTWLLLGGSGMNNIQGYFDFDPNTTHHLKACIEGGNITGYLDDNLLVTISNQNDLGGYTGFGSQYFTGYLDNFKIESAGADLAVPVLKQTGSPWGTTIYDGANNWFPSDPTMSRWGCALTSSAMILQYNGITKLPDGTPLDPGSLNTWLKNNHGFDDGINNGYLIPAAISRLTKKSIVQNNLPVSFDALEANIISGFHPDILTADLNNSQADILGVNGDSHFVVAKGIAGGSFEINDPYFNRDSLVNGYNNTFSSMTQYKQSHTDISYIFISTTSNVSAELKDSNGIVQGSSFVQQPIIDPIGNTSSGQASKIISFPKPQSGNYSLVFTNTTDQYYKTNIYLFDTNGDMTKISDQGTVGQGSLDTRIITFNANSASSSSEVRTVSFQKAIDDVNESQNLNLLKGGGGLVADLRNGQKAMLSGDIATEQTKLNQFIGHISQQRGKGITEAIYQILLYDANYLLNHLQ